MSICTASENMYLTYKRSIVVYLCLLISLGCFAQERERDSLQSAPEKRGWRKFVIPAVFLGYGAVSLTGDNFIRELDYSTHAELLEDHPSFAVKLDNYLRYTPAIAVYGLDLMGVEAKNNIVDRSMMLGLSLGIMAASVSTVKGLSNRTRPSGENDHSFPSGHTATAFMVAEFLHQEYKHKSLWYSVVGYSIATGTGIFRLYNKAHWVSDVVAGAGFGLLSTKLAYLVYPVIKKKVFKGKSANLNLSPFMRQDVKGVTFTYLFDE